MNLFFIFLGCCGVVFLVYMITFDRAPDGYEDREGFHRGTPKDKR